MSWTLVTRGRRLPPVERVPETVAKPTTPRLPEMVAEEILILSLRDSVRLDPRDTSPPPERLVPELIVTLELDRALLGMLDRVLELASIVLLVSVWVLVVKTSVPAARVKLAKVGLLAFERF